jgi:hypothetical protein
VEDVADSLARSWFAECDALAAGLQSGVPTTDHVIPTDVVFGHDDHGRLFVKAGLPVYLDEHVGQLPNVSRGDLKVIDPQGVVVVAGPGLGYANDDRTQRKGYRDCALIFGHAAGEESLGAFK